MKSDVRGQIKCQNQDEVLHSREAVICDLRRNQTEGNLLQPQINTDLCMKNLKHMEDMKNVHQRHS